MQPIYRNYVKICSVFGMSALFFFWSSLWELCEENISIVFCPPRTFSLWKFMDRQQWVANFIVMSLNVHLNSYNSPTRIFTQ